MTAEEQDVLEAKTYCAGVGSLTKLRNIKRNFLDCLPMLWFEFRRIGVELGVSEEDLADIPKNDIDPELRIPYDLNMKIAQYEFNDLIRSGTTMSYPHKLGDSFFYPSDSDEIKKLLESRIEDSKIKKKSLASLIGKTAVALNEQIEERKKFLQDTIKITEEHLSTTHA